MKNRTLRVFARSLFAAVASIPFWLGPLVHADPARITGAFGYTFGESFNPASAIIVSRMDDLGIIRYSVTPPDPNPVFTDYTLSVIGEAKKIFEIQASRSGPDNPLFADKILDLLITKYGPPLKPGQTYPAVGGIVTVIDSNSSAAFHPIFTDHAHTITVDRQPGACSVDYLSPDLVKSTIVTHDTAVVRDVTGRGL